MQPVHISFISGSTSTQRDVDAHTQYSMALRLTARLTRLHIDIAIGHWSLPIRPIAIAHRSLDDV